MQIQLPYKGQLRRTYHDGLSVYFKLNEKQIELSTKLGHIQVPELMLVFVSNEDIMV